MNCPAENTWVRFLGGELEAATIHDLEAHLDRCEECRFVYADLARGDASSAPATQRSPRFPIAIVPPAVLARGTLVDRYVILDTLGRGGMGVVYKAFDPDLDRPIALKLVGLGGEGSQLEQARARLLREAKTLARLSHPNVVAVHDVGTYQGDVFVAMEFVAGGNLRAWLRDRTRAPREILAVFVAAASGLAAAHRLGIVHRDFKPENVMVGDDGRVRVVDFGLARLALPAARPSLPAIASGEPDDAELTADGAVLGTPAYMAPEQDRGDDADARSDQFSFCAALYEALYGQRPFAGRRYAELREHRLAGDLTPPPNVRGVPGRARRAVLRGLRTDPAERHASIDALRAELVAHRRNIARAAVATLAATTLAAGGWALWLATRDAPSIADTCELSADDVDRVWNERRRAEVIASFEAVNVPGARAMAIRVGELADRWTAEWSKHRTALCEQIVRGELDPRVNAPDRLACLRGRLDSLDAAITIASVTTSPQIVARADRMLEELPSPAGCDTSTSRTIVTEQIRERWKPMLQDLVAARLAQAAGNLSEAERLARQTIEQARAKHEREPLAAALLMLGQIQSAKGELEPAIASLRESIRIATEVRDEVEIVDAWLEIVSMGFRDSRVDRHVDEALFNLELAVMRLPADDDRRAHVAYKLGSVHLVRGNLDAAKPPLDDALAWFSRDRDKYRLEIAAVENSLGMYHSYRAEWTQARPYLERALATWESLGGPNPNTAATLGILGDTYSMQHQYAEAEPYLVRSLAVLEQSGEVGRATMPRTLYHLGSLYANSGRCAKALPLFARSREIATELHGKDSAMVALGVYGEGLCQLETGSPRDALPTLERARALAAAQPISPVQLPAIDFARARAMVLVDPRSKPRAIELATSARDGVARYPAMRADQARVVEWLERQR